MWGNYLDRTSSWRLFVSVLGVIFAAEAIIMVVFYLLGEQASFSGVFTDATILMALVTGPLYFLILRPMNRERFEAARTTEMLHAIEEHLPDAVIAIDEHGIIQRFNPAAEMMFGYKASRIIGNSVNLLMPEPYASEHDGYIRNYMKTRKPKVMGRFRELEARRCDGSLVPIEIEANDLYVNKQHGFVAILRDVSERKRAQERQRQMQEKLERTQRLESLGIVAGGVAHNFNNILASIQGNAELIHIRMPASKEEESYMQSIMTGCRRASELCQQMLAYAGLGAYEVQPLDMSRVIRDMWRLLQASVPENIRISKKFQETPVLIEADLSRIQQVALNLISNAVEAIGEKKGSIHVATGIQALAEKNIAGVHGSDDLSPGNYVWLEVRDNGCGMSPDVKNHIFEPFFTTKLTGRGLGMSAILGIVRSQHGGITIDSIPGKGSTIRILIPVTKEAK